ncbi:MAG: PHB depolymerase family esterase, partial [Pseudomonadota bacterium]
WNATNACCDFFGDAPDDSAYLRQLIEVIAASYPVDPLRVYVVGFSNGGFMTHVMACDHADRIAAIIGVAGMQWQDASQCLPSESVSVVHLHGANDTVIDYAGGCIPTMGCFPSARDTAAIWALLNGCEVTPQLRLPMLDLVDSVDGEDTVRFDFADCAGAGIEVEFWTTFADRHLLSFSPNFATVVVEFLLSHPKAPR